MAEALMPESEGVSPIDPAEEIVAERYCPQPPDWPFDLDKVFLSYDRTTDTLMVFFYGRGRPAIVRYIGDDLYGLADPDTHDLLGYQVEHFLTHAKKRPDLLYALELAELRDMTGEQVREVRRRALGFWGTVAFLLRRELLLRRPGTERARSRLLAELLTRQEGLRRATAMG